MLDAIDHRHFDIASAERLLHFGKHLPDMKAPRLSKVNVADTLTNAMIWYGAKTVRRPDFQREQEIFFFPLMAPAIEEWELISPTEWHVRFVGSAEGLQQSSCYRHCSGTLLRAAAAINGQFALLQTKPFMIGLDRQDMSRRYYLAPLVSRVEESTLIAPAPYAHAF